MKATINGIVIEGEPKELAQFVDEWLNLPERKGVAPKKEQIGNKLLEEWMKHSRQSQQSQSASVTNMHPWTYYLIY